MPRDFQRSRVYRWQWALKRVPADATLEVGECLDLIQTLWHRYWSEVSLPVRFISCNRCWARGGVSGIALPPWARNVATVLHEVAHALVDHVYVNNIDVAPEAGHGPRFMATYIMLLSQYGFGTYGELRKSARAAGIKVAPRSACPRPRGLTEAERQGRRRARWREQGRRYRERKRVQRALTAMGRKEVS